jgi:hypothetical protein
MCPPAVLGSSLEVFMGKAQLDDGTHARNTAMSTAAVADHDAEADFGGDGPDTSERFAEEDRWCSSTTRSPQCLECPGFRIYKSFLLPPGYFEVNAQLLINIMVIR